MTKQSRPIDFAGGQADGMPRHGELLHAAMFGPVEEVRRLIAAGASIKERDEVNDGGGAVQSSGSSLLGLKWCKRAVQIGQVYNIGSARHGTRPEGGTCPVFHG